MIRPIMFRWFLRVAILLVLGIAVLAIALKAYHLLRGRRNRDQGIPCIRCRRRAFRVAGSPKRYRCWTCAPRFDAAEHDRSPSTL
jgi:hypothetical protein